MVRREMLIARLWYFCYSGSQVFFFPYISLFLQQLGWDPMRVGLVQGLRPWVSAPCSLLLCSLADRFRIHRAVLLSCFLLSVALRGSLSLLSGGGGGGVAAVAGLLLLAEAVGSPVGVIADATVVAQCTDPSDYGKQRVWASIGWGGLSTVAGALISHTSVRAGMLAYVVLSAPNIFFAWLMSPPRQASAAASASAVPLDGGSGEGTAASAQRGGESAPGPAAAVPVAASAVAAASKGSAPPPAGRPAAAQPDLSAPLPAPAPRLALPALLHLGRRGPAADDDLRTRLLAASARSPSPCPPSPAPSSPSPRRGAGLAAHCTALPEPLLCEHGASDGGAGGADPAANSDSCCSSPRSTAALLDPLDRLRPLSPSLLALRGVGERAAGAEERAPSAKAGDPAAADEAIHEAAHAVAGGAAADGDALVQVSLQPVRGESQKALLGAGAAMSDAVAAAKPAAAEPQAPAPQDGGAGLLALLSSARVVTFLLRGLVIGFGLGAQGSFASLLVLDLGGSEVLIGLMLLFSILTEAPAFQFQSALLSRVPVAVVMDASMVLLALRLGGYALLPHAPSAWAVLPIELLHGVTFATSWGAGIVTCKRLAPPHLNATMQSVFSALYGGVGSGLGAIIGGVLMARHGAPAMFGMCAGIVLGGWAAACAADAAVAALRRRGGAGATTDPLQSPGSGK
ncbi:hypothetical protein Rsub_01539 [Raphidocelis subcapitata]|uniref:Major facilitator superfamily associated domain-containing protein n=1 Tax=Raphidocelis subcapitata TaxID=307507 RepID=A0A2V0NSU0_9CHLO|nr:hypothetical protein Rsub_01539 [Raphidocelis subcapitata]|eukprot:GBF88640.1 hypothetical protein Rsub_01539 [Raphidocelis subcapitata]